MPCRGSLAQVKIMVNDGDYVEVEAGKLGTVKTTGIFYDPDVGSSYEECSPDECSAALTRVCVLASLWNVFQRHTC